MRALAELKEKHGFKLMIDGSCSPAVIEELSAMGADGFILGTSACSARAVRMQRSFRS